MTPRQLPFRGCSFLCVRACRCEGSISVRPSHSPLDVEQLYPVHSRPLLAGYPELIGVGRTADAGDAVVDEGDPVQDSGGSSESFQVGQIVDLSDLSLVRIASVSVVPDPYSHYLAGLKDIGQYRVTIVGIRIPFQVEELWDCRPFQFRSSVLSDFECRNPLEAEGGSGARRCFRQLPNIELFRPIADEKLVAFREIHDSPCLSVLGVIVFVDFEFANKRQRPLRFGGDRRRDGNLVHESLRFLSRELNDSHNIVAIDIGVGGRIEGASLGEVFIVQFHFLNGLPRCQLDDPHLRAAVLSNRFQSVGGRIGE
mmetsp:Transcript_14729/g.34208  ORF Transcript_14729/g.34208 Transcript_14729/m.34208 type:complete len:312 (+) Transcript_14729:712-1647(+)